MVASQRVSRAFNRLGLFLAAMPLLVGGSISLFIALNAANNGSVHHQHLLCAHKHVSPVALSDEEVGLPLSLKQVGCSESEYAAVTYAEARNPPDFNWLTTFGSAMFPSVPITLALTLAVYALVRAIGWVIGGFAAM